MNSRYGHLISALLVCVSLVLVVGCAAPVAQPPTAAPAQDNTVATDVPAETIKIGFLARFNQEY